MSWDSGNPSTVSAESMISRAAENVSYRSRAIPTYWEPCPGKTHAIVIPDTFYTKSQDRKQSRDVHPNVPTATRAHCAQLPDLEPTRQSGSLRGFLFLDRNDLGALVIAAVGADPVRHVKVVAVETLGQVWCFERQVTAAAITASLG